MQANRLNFCFSFRINDIQTEVPQASRYLSCLNPANNADTPRPGQALTHTMDTLLTADPEFLDYSLQSLFRILEASIWFIEHWSRPE